MPSPRRLLRPGGMLLAVVAACLAPLGVGMLVDASSTADTPLVTWAGPGSPPDARPGDTDEVASAPDVAQADGAAGGAQRSEPASGEGRLYDFGNTSEAAGGPSTTAPPPPSTTTTTTPPTTTTTTPSTTAPPAVGVQGGPTAGHVAAVVELTNDARRRAGCGELVVDDRLVAAAQAHSDDMAAQGYFSHTSLDGRSFADRIRAAGYPSPGGENIARGQRSAAEVVAAWMDSPGHRANILNCSFRAIGVGLHEGTWTWTQVFGR